MAGGNILLVLVGDHKAPEENRRALAAYFRSS